MQPVHLQILGGVLCILGILIEGLAAISMTSYNLRRKLPVKSPFTLLSIGGVTFFSGVAMMLLKGLLT